MKKKCMTWAAVLLLIMATKTTKAQNEVLLDEVSVTSSLVEHRSSETGRNVTVINGSAIAKLPVNSLDELLKYIPGIDVQARGPQGSQSDISMRGGTFQQVLVMLDGLRLNDPNTGHFSAYIPIAPAEIERIEILKGASSAIYGSDAVGGVINIITKTYGRNKKYADKYQNISAKVSAGEYGLFNVNAGGFINADKLRISAGVLSNNAKGVQQHGTRGFFHNTSASAGVSYQLSQNWEIAYRGAYDNRDFAAQNFYTTYLSDTASENVSSWWHQANVRYHKARTKINLDMGYKYLDDRYAYNPSSTANSSKSKMLQGLLTWQQILGESSTLISGFNFLNRRIHSNDRGDHELNTAAPFVGWVYKPGWLMVHPSLRLEFIGKNDPELLPQLDVSAKVQQWQLRASGGRTIRDADFTERYNNYNKPLVQSGRIGNPWLVPEKSWSYEAGADYFAGQHLKVSATFFQRFHSQLIDWVSTPYDNMPRKDNLKEGSVFDLASNIDTVNTTGLETDIQWAQRISTNQTVRANAGLVWLSSTSSAEGQSFYVRSQAKFLFNFSVVYQVSNVELGFTGLYKKRNPQDDPTIHAAVSKDYFVLNGNATYSLLKNRLGVFAQVDNIFDRKYSDLLGAIMPGRWLQCGVKLNLERAK
ncbi:MAG: TonB-dependent receptor [Niabella sp.]